MFRSKQISWSWSVLESVLLCVFVSASFVTFVKNVASSGSKVATGEPRRKAMKDNQMMWFSIRSSLREPPLEYKPTSTIFFLCRRELQKTKISSLIIKTSQTKRKLRSRNENHTEGIRPQKQRLQMVKSTTLTKNQHISNTYPDLYHDVSNKTINSLTVATQVI